MRNVLRTYWRAARALRLLGHKKGRFDLQASSTVFPSSFSAGRPCPPPHPVPHPAPTLPTNPPAPSSKFCCLHYFTNYVMLRNGHQPFLRHRQRHQRGLLSDDGAAFWAVSGHAVSECGAGRLEPTPMRMGGLCVWCVCGGGGGGGQFLPGS